MLNVTNNINNTSINTIKINTVCFDTGGDFDMNDNIVGVTINNQYLAVFSFDADYSEDGESAEYHYGDMVSDSTSWNVCDNLCNIKLQELYNEDGDDLELSLLQVTSTDLKSVQDIIIDLVAVS